MALRMALVLLGVLANGWAQSASPAPVTLAVHLLVGCSSAGTGQPVKFPGVDARLCLDRAPFLTHKDVRSAELRTGLHGSQIIFITLHEDAAVRELEITRKNAGNHVAILVNGRVVAAPLIASASRFLYIEGAYTEKQALALVDAFNKQAGNR